MSDFRREVVVNGAFDKRDPDPSKNYGIHGCDLRFYVVKDQRAIQFVVYSNWQLPHVRDEFLARNNGPRDTRLFFCPMPADVGYHSPEPLYDGQTLMQGDCEFTGGACYYDGSSLWAEDVFRDVFLPHGTEGPDGLWAWMEREWANRFAPVLTGAE